METIKLWRKVFGWKVGDTCAVQLKTKKVYAKIVKLFSVPMFFPKGHFAMVEYENKSLIPHRQYVSLTELLEDDRKK